MRDNHHWVNVVLRRGRAGLLLGLLLFSRCCSTEAISQACNSAYLVAYGTSPIQLNTYDALLNGGTAVRYMNAQINTVSSQVCPDWRLTVQASGNFTNGNKQLELRYVSIRFNTVVGGPSGNQIGIPTSAFVLSQNETTLIPRSNVPIDVTRYQTYQIQYDMIIQGGNQLLVLSNGEYATNLTFNLWDKYGNLMSTSTTRAVFQVYYDANNTSVVTLQNGASNVVLEFTTPSSIENGVAVNIPSGLSVLSYSPHQVMAKAATNRLTASDGRPDFIPISTIHLTVTLVQQYGNITTWSIPLSATARVVIDNAMSDYTYQNVLYNLRFAISGNDPNIMAAPPGTYTSSVVLSLVPK